MPSPGVSSIDDIMIVLQNLECLVASVDFLHPVHIDANKYCSGCIIVR